MRKELLAATALSTATLTVFGAAAQPALAGTNWAGLYVGGSIGAAGAAGGGSLSYPQGSSNEIFFTGSTPNIDGIESGVSAWPTSFGFTDGRLTGSVAVGRNRQAGNIVFGLEGDMSPLIGGQTWSWHRDDATNSRTSDLSATGGVNFLFTVRPRVGIAVDRLLIYGTGGLAVGQASFATAAHLSEDSGKGADWSGSTTDWRAGVAIGGGVEYALDDHLSLKFQGIYYNLGKMNLTATGTPFGGPTSVDPYTASLNLSGTLVTAGFNARF